MPLPRVYLSLSSINSPNLSHYKLLLSTQPVKTKNTRYDLTHTPAPAALAHEARRVFGDRLGTSDPAAPSAAAFARALGAAITQSGLLGAQEVAAAITQSAAGSTPAAGPDSYFSTLGMSSEERAAAAAAGLAPQLARWSESEFRGLVAGLLKSFEREVKALGLLLVPEVSWESGKWANCTTTVARK